MAPQCLKASFHGESSIIPSFYSFEKCFDYDLESVVQISCNSKTTGISYTSLAAAIAVHLLAVLPPDTGGGSRFLRPVRDRPPRMSRRAQPHVFLEKMEGRYVQLGSLQKSCQDDCERCWEWNQLLDGEVRSNSLPHPTVRQVPIPLPGGLYTTKI